MHRKTTTEFAWDIANEGMEFALLHLFPLETLSDEEVASQAIRARNELLALEEMISRKIGLKRAAWDEVIWEEE